MLFKKERFVSHSGKDLNFKIECDALTDDDWETLAFIISKKYTFNYAYGIPEGGLKLARCLNKNYRDISSDTILLVDDVLTTGKSMAEYKKKFFDEDNVNIIGIVVFSRNEFLKSVPEWIDVIFKMNI